jgi:hypothetical protein
VGGLLLTAPVGSAQGGSPNGIARELEREPRQLDDLNGSLFSWGAARTVNPAGGIGNGILRAVSAAVELSSHRECCE